MKYIVNISETHSEMIEEMMGEDDVSEYASDILKDMIPWLYQHSE